MAYHGIIKCGWKTGIHDCRGLTYEHRWLVVYRPTSEVVGCHSRADARRVLDQLRRGVPAESLSQ